MNLRILEELHEPACKSFRSKFPDLDINKLSWVRNLPSFHEIRKQLYSYEGSDTLYHLSSECSYRDHEEGYCSWRVYDEEKEKRNREESIKIAFRMQKDDIRTLEKRLVQAKESLNNFIDKHGLSPEHYEIL